MFDELPPAPTLVVLFRITYEPGSSFSVPGFPGPLVGVVESGTITARLDGLLAVSHGFSAATPFAEAVATPGADLGLGAGD